MINDVKSCEWMKSVDSSLFINSINIPGTHNSAALRSSFGPFSNCQRMNIPEQLEAGVRFLDIRVEYDVPGEFHIVHAKADCFDENSKFFAEDRKKITFSDIVSDCRKFLSEHPSETVLMLVKEDDGDAGRQLYKTLYENYIYYRDKLWFSENRIPRLCEVRGKIIMLSRLIAPEYFNDGKIGLNLSAWPDQGDKRRDDFLEFDASRRDEAPCARAYVQDRYRLKSTEKFNGAYMNLYKAKTEENAIVINYLSTAGELTPKKSADKINRMFAAEDFSPTSPQIVLFDYITPLLAEKVFKSNNL